MQSIVLDCKRKAAVRQHHEASLKVKADDLQRRLPEAQQRAMAQAPKKGGSSTLTTIPVVEHGFSFDVKADFHDHVHLRYCWPLDNLPSICPCAERFTVDHAQIRKLSGFIHMRHNDPTDFLASCMKEVHNDVEVEPKLQPLTGESLQHRTANTDPDARADIRVRGSGPKAVTHSLTLGFFTHTRDATGPSPSSLCFGRWRVTRRDSTENG